MALVAALGISIPLANADVGLPVYKGPGAEHAPALTEPPTLIRPINFQRGARDGGLAMGCGERTAQHDIALDFAPAPDYRIEDQQSSGGAIIPLHIQNGEAVLQTGRVTNTIKAIRDNERLLLVSEDRDYLNRLQTLRSTDTLLVRTPASVRRYQVTATRIRHSDLAPSDGGSTQTMTLAACYPFQPIESAALLYEVEAVLVDEDVRPQERRQVEAMNLVSF
ncbi:hypothetical protein ACXYTJ_00960 [Gilvimarinus sp. F26214L]|uniref:hypothetical protein n=1 Tax=Gilvimarinus sp. DZF01 TaxID=3461371 RepID=UPI004045D90E